MLSNFRDQANLVDLNVKKIPEPGKKFGINSPTGYNFHDDFLAFKGIFLHKSF